MLHLNSAECNPFGECNMKIYELTPTNGRKSFYGKAQVGIDDDGTETLFSYGTPIMKRGKDGTLARLYDGEPSMTTCTHIKSFCGLDKRGFLKLGK